VLPVLLRDREPRVVAAAQRIALRLMLDPALREKIKPLVLERNRPVR
jgi:hypothetical protein